MYNWFLNETIMPCEKGEVLQDQALFGCGPTFLHRAVSDTSSNTALLMDSDYCFSRQSSWRLLTQASESLAEPVLPEPLSGTRISDQKRSNGVCHSTAGPEIRE